MTRRRFLLALAILRLARRRATAEGVRTPIIDFHQHAGFGGRTNENLARHQKALGAVRTVLLPAGRFGALGAGCAGNEAVFALARATPNRWIPFVNEVVDLPDAPRVIREGLENGARGVGELKFPVHCLSDSIANVAELAREFDAPVLLHFEYGRFNLGFEKFHRVLERFPTVAFVGHASTWWGRIDRNHRPGDSAPGGRVAPGGLTDRLLRSHPNLYGDLSGGPGLNALLRDEEHAREFLTRHQDQLLFGSDCADSDGRGDGCLGARILTALRRLAPSSAAFQKIVFWNARRLLKLRVSPRESA